MLIFVYSAMKNSVSGPAAYSTLNPDTSSDSPSFRWNRARLVYASVEMNHIMVGGHVGMISHICSCVVISADTVACPVDALVSHAYWLLVSCPTNFPIYPLTDQPRC
jgi:hypothetical protein